MCIGWRCASVICVHIILYTYTICHCTASSPRSLGGRTSAERLSLLSETDGTYWRIVLSSPPPFSCGRASCFRKGDLKKKLARSHIRREGAKPRCSSFLSVLREGARYVSLRPVSAYIISFRRKTKEGKKLIKRGFHNGALTRVTGETILRIFTRTANAIA